MPGSMIHWERHCHLQCVDEKKYNSIKMTFLPKLISSLTCPSIVYDDYILFWDIKSKEASIQFK